MSKRYHDKSRDLNADVPKSFNRRGPTRADGRRALKNEDYTIAWIAALYIEAAAAYAMLDEEHESLSRSHADNNSYTLGSISGHNVVVACLSNLQYGNNQATLVVQSLKSTFPSIRHCLMVGIGGAAPVKTDIRLGDIVVGTRVMQYDLGKTGPEGAWHELYESQVPVILEERMKRHAKFQRPDAEDQLYEADYVHQSQIAGCENCDPSRLLTRRARRDRQPVIHYGAIASGNRVMKNGVERDNIGRELNVLCFEMESAGVTEVVPCLPIRGICDYSDSHKSDDWQRYAAAVAAAYAREFLDTLAVVGGSRSMGELEKPIDTTERHARRGTFLESLIFDSLDYRKSDIKSAHINTCQWMLQAPRYKLWLASNVTTPHRGFFWIIGKPGSGKSTMMKFLYMQQRDMSHRNREKNLVASFFFNARGDHLGKSVSGLYRSLLLQVLQHFQDLQSVIDYVDHNYKRSNVCPHLNVLKDTFTWAVLQLGKRSLTCFIDALDESDEQQVTEMVRDFEDLAEQCRNSRINFRICFSSRPYPYIHMRFATPFLLEGEPGHRNDMETFARSRLLVGKATQELLSEVVRKSNGVFLWVVLVVNILNDDYKEGGLTMRRKLRDIPSELSELFRNILCRDERNKRQVYISLIWVLLAFKPLEPIEFCHAVWAGRKHDIDADNEPPSLEALATDEQVNNMITSSSKGLAEIARGSNSSTCLHKGKRKATVQFIHESVRDFLIKDGGLQTLWRDLGPSWAEQGHDRLKSYCRQYLSLPELNQGVPNDKRATILPKYPFVEYASRYMLQHAEAATHSVDQTLWMEDWWLSKWLPILKLCEAYGRTYATHETPLSVLAKRGLAGLIRLYLQRHPMAACDKGSVIHPLITAYENGQPRVVAAILGLDSAARDMLDIRKTDGYGSQYYSRRCGRYDYGPLTWAVSYRYESLLVALKTSGLPCTVEDQRIALGLVIKHGYMHLIHLFPEVLLHSSQWTSSYYLAQAILKSQHPLEAICRQSGAHVSFLNSLGRTPLMQIISENGGALAVDSNMERLVDETDLGVIDRNGHTVHDLCLPREHIAVCNEEVSASETVLDGGSIHVEKHCAQAQLLLYLVYKRPVTDTTSLLLRAMKSWPYHAPTQDRIRTTEKVICVLVEKHLTDETSNIAGSTQQLIDESLRRADYSTMLKLLSRSTTRPGPDALQAFATLVCSVTWDPTRWDEVARVSVMNRLIELDIDLNSPLLHETMQQLDGNSLGAETLLHQCLLNGLIAVAGLLLDTGRFNINTSCHGKPLLFLPLSPSAKGSNSCDMIEFLLDRGATPDVFDADGQSLISLSIAKGCKEVAELLLDKGLGVNVRNQFGESPVLAYLYDINLSKPLDGFNFKHTSLETMCFLIDRGADVQILSRDKQCALHLTLYFYQLIQEKYTSEGHPWDYRRWLNAMVTLVERVIAEGVDLCHIGKNGFTALHLAIESPFVEIVSLLIERGCPVDIKDSSGRTALHLVQSSSSQSSLAMMSCLLNHEAQVNQVDDLGCTPLHFAASSHKYEAVETLVAHGADVYARNNEQQRPFDVALRQGWADSGCESHSALLILDSGIVPGMSADEEEYRDRIQSTTDADIGPSDSVIRKGRKRQEAFRRVRKWFSGGGGGTTWC